MKCGKYERDEKSMEYLFGKAERKLLGRPRSRWNNYIKTGIR